MLHLSKSIASVHCSSIQNPNTRYSSFRVNTTAYPQQSLKRVLSRTLCDARIRNRASPRANIRVFVDSGSALGLRALSGTNHVLRLGAALKHLRAARVEAGDRLLLGLVEDDVELMFLRRLSGNVGDLMRVVVLTKV